jgi:hypothetical protein
MVRAPRLVIAHDEVAEPIGRSCCLRAVHNVQVGPLDGDLVAIASEMLEELLQGSHMLLQIFLGLICSDDRQRPGEQRQHEQPTGQAALPAELPVDGVGTLFQGFEAFLQVVHRGSSSTLPMAGQVSCCSKDFSI